MGTKTKALFLGFLFSLVFSLMDFTNKCDGISNKILRLHIMANSNSVEDQSLKLKVRDKILEVFSSELKGFQNLEVAKRNLESNLEEIKRVAQEEVYKEGYNYKVNAEVVNMYFSIRKYQENTLPSGFYDALRITIGEGKGKNWWCVMFPPMCLPAAEEEIELDNVLTPCECKIVENESEYIIKFKITELLMEIKNFLNNLFYQESTDNLNSLKETPNLKNESQLEFIPSFKICEIFNYFSE